MKFGIREICDVVLKAKAAQKIGNKIFYANEPVLYFDTLKSSSMEGASTTVYAQGGRGNTRLVAWEGERTVTFTMEDALISPEGFMILTGAGLVEAGTGDNALYQHASETVDASYIHTYGELQTPDTSLSEEAQKELKDIGSKVAAVYTSIKNDDLVIPVTHIPHLPDNKNGDYAYVMFVNRGEIQTEPYIPVHLDKDNTIEYVVLSTSHNNYNDYIEGEVAAETQTSEAHTYSASWTDVTYDSVIVDYYIKKTSGVKQIEISAESFGGNFYLEASTLFRDTNGSDLPAEFIIPNCKIQSNFNFTMASSGDPSTFTFTMDAFPDYTRWDRSKKVLAAIQILGADEKASLHRHSTAAEDLHHKEF